MIQPINNLPRIVWNEATAMMAYLNAHKDECDLLLVHDDAYQYGGTKTFRVAMYAPITDRPANPAQSSDLPDTLPEFVNDTTSLMAACRAAWNAGAHLHLVRHKSPAQFVATVPMSDPAPLPRRKRPRKAA